MTQITSFTVPGVCPKPRETQRDRWNPSESVLRWRTWAGQARSIATGDPMKKIDSKGFFGILVIAHLSLPDSWSQKKKDQHAGRIHQQRPDSDNILKGVLDACFAEDALISWVQLIKLWCEDQGESRCDIFLLGNPIE